MYVCSWERTAHRFAQLSSELLQEQISMEGVYLLLQELRTAAHRQVALCRLFWKVTTAAEPRSTRIAQFSLVGCS